MPIFNTATLERFFDDGEQIITQERPYMVDRLSLDLTAGQNIYLLPDYIVSIRRVTFKGYSLDPLPARNFREAFQNSRAAGRPYWYVFNNIARNSIQFFPGIATSLPAVADAWNQNRTNSYQNGLVIEFGRVADGVNFTLPAYFRRALLKQFVARQCFAIEGPGQNLKMSQYFAQRWNLKKQQFFDFLEDTHVKSRKLVISDLVSGNRLFPDPVLPIDRFGTSVETGY